MADKRSPGARLLALVLHPVTPPLWLGIVVAVVCIAVEGALTLYLGHTVPGSTFGVVFLFGVLVVSAGWGFTLAAITSVVSALVYYYVHRSDGGGLERPSHVVTTPPSSPTRAASSTSAMARG